MATDSAGAGRREALLELGGRLRRAVRGALAAERAQEGGAGRGALSRPVGRGVGDVTFGLDAVAEEVVAGWFEERAAEGALSLLTEDAGWRHRGPAPGDGGPVALDGYGHGGPRVTVDPVDGTRNLMHDLRSAWAVLAAAPPGDGQPRLSDVEVGCLVELPDTRAARARVLAAERGRGATLSLVDVATDEVLVSHALRADDDDRLDHGYFPFFGYHPEQRAAVQALAARVFARAAAEDGADRAHCYDDQYISSGGQLALVALGAYRAVVEARAALGIDAPTAKPYDIAGAVLVAREAGGVVLGLDGRDLDVPLDASTPVAFAAFHNAATARRLWRHLAPELDR